MTRTLFIAVLVAGMQMTAAPLLTHVDVTVTSGTWEYTLFNDDPLSSTEWISSFLLIVAAPVAAVGAPGGWSSQTDNATYVLWLNADIDPPYPNDIPPGSSLGGFVLQSPGSSSYLLGYEMASWDHEFGLPGSSSRGAVDAPLATPEPGSWCLMACAALCFVLCRPSRSRLAKVGRS